MRTPIHDEMLCHKINAIFEHERLPMDISDLKLMGRLHEIETKMMMLEDITSKLNYQFIELASEHYQLKVESMKRSYKI